MYKSKLVKFGAIALVLGCVAVGCGDKKEDNPTKNANATDVTTEADDVSDSTKETTGKTEPGDDFQQIIDDTLADKWHCSPYGVMSKLEEAGYDYDFVEKYVNNMDIDWLPYAKTLAENEIYECYRSEADIRARLSSEDGYTDQVIDKTISELNIDFTDICYKYLYWKFNGRYPEDEADIADAKEYCQLIKFTDSQIDAAITKLAENCK